MIINDYIDKVRYQSGNVYTYVFYASTDISQRSQK